MIKFLEILLSTCIVLVVGGFTLTAMSLMLNEAEIALMFASITSYTVLPLLFLSIFVQYRIDRKDDFEIDKK